MSNEIRAAALTAAVAVVGDNGVEAVLGAASQFADFIAGADKAEAAPAKPAAPKKAEKTKPPGPTKEQCSKALEELLSANKKPEAIELLKSFGAKNVSTLPEDKYGEFIEKAGGILLT